MGIIYNIGVHHSGPVGANSLSSSKHLTLEQIDSYHKSRGFNKSNLGYYVGYTFVLFPDRLVQTREIGEETCAATGHNFDTIHICVVGNFTKNESNLPVDLITDFQRKTLIALCRAITRNHLEDYAVKKFTTVNVSLSSIFPHRVLQPNHTSCYGDFYSDTYFRDLVVQSIEHDLGILRSLLNAYQKLLLYLNQTTKVKVGGHDHSCDGFISLETQ